MIWNGIYLDSYSNGLIEIVNFIGGATSHDLFKMIVSDEKFHFFRSF